MSPAKKKMVDFPGSFTARYFIILLLFLQLPTLCSAKFSVIGPSGPVLARLGGVAVLPCHLDSKESAEEMEVRWFRTQPSNIVHQFKKGDVFGEQMKEYQGRTEMVKHAIDKGSVALRIRNISLSDEGKYHCSFKDDAMQAETTMDLQLVGPLIPRAYPLMVALAILVPILGLIIAGGLYVIWKQHKEKQKLRDELKSNRAKLEERKKI
ncbi:myelin-oligodendrocyte glycoprotein-like isoform X2 [Tachyglossus aculeatus]|uniref:myelin-oligodendrocyte glycoprotein-like isoform X2 n=1 Tax=Tachyglossus aculeatus TaxID=9261 RepID=UPI0018F3E3F8|nr:myelin-oligodendrocyte glycoprotein-like isoform X2 [Tachyglossus aculeatus]